ncbi:clumping factor B-like [Pteronotus mesoamericanus]|uniref:clumping factor B-like n=1 Tax=Pteronotus mesoamericanus TaxID=1884717 RepID=UPI0023EC1E83|nr:clumping factor B-like [Pteronotus parnellii mesoamericanus]
MANETEETMEPVPEEETPTPTTGVKRKSDSQVADEGRRKVRLPSSSAPSSSPRTPPPGRLLPCPRLAQAPPQVPLSLLPSPSYGFPTHFPQSNVFPGGCRKVSEKQPDADEENQPDADEENQPDADEENQPDADEENQPDADEENQPDTDEESQPDTDEESLPDTDEENQEEAPSTSDDACDPETEDPSIDAASLEEMPE